VLRKIIFYYFLSKVSGVLYYKYGTIYRDVMKLNKVNACDAFKLASESILIRQILVIGDAAAPGLIHECPYYV
jgi:hypothetical protein